MWAPNYWPFQLVDLLCCVIQALGGDERERLIKMELWVGENYQQWKKEKEEEMKEKFAESSKHKMYR